MNNMPPIYYDYANASVSSVSPSTLHALDNNLTEYFKRYLLQKAMSVYEWKLPEFWDKDYFLYCLYCNGFVGIINTEKFGVIPQNCGLMGYNIFYRPTKILVANSLLSPVSKEYTIDEECVLLKLQPNYSSIMDIVDYYGVQLSLCSSTLGTNLFNSKLAYVFGVNNKQSAEAMKKLYDRIASGEPAVVMDKALFNDDGSASWLNFNNDLKGNYIVSDLLADMRKIEAQFDTEIGIPNANTEKRERLITDEVNANNVETVSRADMWLEQLKKGCEKANAMFGIDMSVDWRYKTSIPEIQEVNTDA